MFTMLQKFSIEQKFECPWSSCKRDTKLTNLRYENKILYFFPEGGGRRSGVGLIRGLAIQNLFASVLYYQRIQE